MTGSHEPDAIEAGQIEAGLRDAVDDLNGLRDELYIAGYDVPMPVRPDREDHIQRILAAHRAAERTPAAATRGRSRRRFFTLAGGVAAAASAGTAGWLAYDQSHPRSAFAATPRALVVRPVSGDARRRLGQIAGRVRGPATAGPVDHLLTVGWDLDSQVSGHTVRSAVIASRHELWRAADDTALAIDENEPPEFPTERDRADWQDDGSPGADRSPRRTPYPEGSFVASWTGRPPAEPGRLEPWLRRQDPTDAAIPSAIAELLRERVLTAPEHRALLAVLATQPGLRLLGTTTDRAGRAGLAFASTSSASGGDVSYRYVISPDTGAVLAHEKVLTGGAKALPVHRPAVISYVTYLKAEFVPAIP
jgi:hypothetical protein